jgi:hypothetical protein
VRVTELTCDMAALISAQTEGPFADVWFSDAELKQLRYAGLLHDFGKVAVREETLVKELKLPPVMGARVEARFALIRKTLELEAWIERGRIVAERGIDAARDDLARIDAELAAEVERLDRYWAAVQEANVPRVLDEDAAEILQEISRTTFVDPDGKRHPYITAAELHFLEIRRGSLDEAEREQIQAHVLHSYDFLLDIPWTDELSRIAEIVRGHHEKLDGSGYPDGVTGDRLPIETRIMTVCDIFDALTASDRPYKRAMPVERALEILEWEANEGMLDKDVVELFASSGVYQKVLEKDWREF